jgi:hypothetical protein
LQPYSRLKLRSPCQLLLLLLPVAAATANLQHRSAAAARQATLPAEHWPQQRLRQQRRLQQRQASQQGSGCCGALDSQLQVCQHRASA